MKVQYSVVIVLPMYLRWFFRVKYIVKVGCHVFVLILSITILNDIVYSIDEL